MDRPPDHESTTGPYNEGSIAGRGTKYNCVSIIARKTLGEDE